MANPSQKTAVGTISPRARTIIISISSGMSTGGVILGLQDSNDTGVDDEIAQALQVAADVFRKIGTSGQSVNRNDIVKAIADGLYLRIGLTPVDE